MTFFPPMRHFEPLSAHRGLAVVGGAGGGGCGDGGSGSAAVVVATVVIPGNHSPMMYMVRYS